MPTASKLAKICLALALTTLPARAGLIVTEVMSSGSINDWFELTNTGPLTLSLSGYKMDDNSFSLAVAVPLSGVLSIAPDESVVFIESAAPGADVPAFRSFWGGSAQTIQIGSYTGSGVGLSSASDGVIIFDNNGLEVTRVSFGAATSNISFGYAPASYPSQAGFGGLSSAGVNGAYTSANAANNIGSPGLIPEPGSALLLLMGGAALLQWRRFRRTAGLAAAACLLATPAVQAQYDSTNRNIYVPNTGTAPAGGITLGGTTFINLGLQGVGRLPAAAKDPVTGESLGSISDLQVLNWTRNADGSYSGLFEALPDRGYNSGSVFSNYAARINDFNVTFTPYTSTAATTAQNQLTLTFAGSTRFTYDDDSNASTPAHFTTGLLATGTGTLFGQTIPVAPGTTTIPFGGSTPGSDSTTNRLTVDAEGLALDPRTGKEGSGWVGDEYGGYIYHFNATKQIDGMLTIPAALVPHSPTGTINFAADPPTNGRRANQGFEGVAVNKAGTRLFTLLQSATIQDSGSGSQGRSNTRLLVYDTSLSDTPTVPIAQYVIQLPVLDDTGATTNGTSVNKTAAQSSIIVLNDHQLLILSRDGNGRGSTGSPVFKSILLADLSVATNINGLYDAEGAAVAPGGVLAAGVTPLTWVEALNMIGRVDLPIAEVEQFGLNLNAGPGDINTLSEKWEGMALVSAQDPNAPNDYFLFVGNDNDFLTASGKYLDAAGSLQSYNAGLENDTTLLAYRVQVVPEPATAGLLACGCVVAALVRRRRG